MKFRLMYVNVFSSRIISVKGVFDIHGRFVVGVAYDARGRMGLVGRLVHSLLPHGAGPHGLAWLAGGFRQFAADSVG